MCCVPSVTDDWDEAGVSGITLVLRVIWCAFFLLSDEVLFLFSCWCFWKIFQRLDKKFLFSFTDEHSKQLPTTVW